MISWRTSPPLRSLRKLAPPLEIMGNILRRHSRCSLKLRRRKISFTCLLSGSSLMLSFMRITCCSILMFKWTMPCTSLRTNCRNLRRLLKNFSTGSMCTFTCSPKARRLLQTSSLPARTLWLKMRSSCRNDWGRPSPFLCREICQKISTKSSESMKISTRKTWF